MTLEKRYTTAYKNRTFDLVTFLSAISQGAEILKSAIKEICTMFASTQMLKSTDFYNFFRKERNLDFSLWGNHIKPLIHGLHYFSIFSPAMHTTTTYLLYYWLIWIHYSECRNWEQELLGDLYYFYGHSVLKSWKLVQ